jgi:hypothetical protein
MNNIKWNEVTWYSKWGAIILFVLVVPALAFCIGAKYQEVTQVLSEQSVVVPEVAIHHNPVEEVSPASEIIKGSSVSIYKNHKRNFEFSFPSTIESTITNCPQWNSSVFAEECVGLKSQDESLNFMIFNGTNHDTAYFYATEMWTENAMRSEGFVKNESININGIEWKLFYRKGTNGCDSAGAIPGSFQCEALSLTAVVVKDNVTYVFFSKSDLGENNKSIVFTKEVLKTFSFK